MRPQTAELIQTFHTGAERWNGRDLDGFLELFAEDAEVQPDPVWPDSGPIRGKASIRRFLEEFLSPFESLRFAADEIERRDPWLVVRARWITRGRASGVETELPFTMVVRIEDGRFSAFGTFFDRAAALRYAGLEA